MQIQQTLEQQFGHQRLAVEQTLAIEALLALPRNLAALTFVVGLIVCGNAFGHDGEIQWRTIHTAHAQVHFPSTHRAMAQHVADVFEDGWRELTPVFNYRAVTPVHVTIDDYVDATNGFANPRPYDLIHVRAYPPRWLDDLAGHGDWVRLLIFHELAHLLHLGNHAGVSKLVNTVLGRTYLPNQYAPRLLVEGIAVWAETRKRGFDRHGSGRIDSAQFMMKLRAMVLDKAMPKLQELTGRPLRWPRGNGWYLFGSLLIDYQVRHYGEAKLQQFIQTYGSRPVPFAVNALYKKIYGVSALRMWDDAVAELRRRVRREQRLRDHGLVPPKGTDDVLKMHVPLGPPTERLPHEGRRLTRDGETKGRVRLHPTKPIAVYVHVPNDKLPRIMAVNITTGAARTLRTCELGCREPVFSSDGRWLHWSEGRPWRRIYSFQQLFKAPVLADGRLGAVVQQTVDQRVRRVVAKLATRKADARTPVAVADLRTGYDRQGKWALVDRGAFRDLTCNGAPIVLPRSGIRSFAVDERRGLVAMITPHSVGHELHATALPPNWPELCRRGAAVAVRKNVIKPRKTKQIEGPYAPWRAMRPRAWRPLLQISGEPTTDNISLGLAFSGRDPVAQHSYQLSAQSDLRFEKPVVTGTWTLRRFEPTWSAAASWIHSWTYFTRGHSLYWLRDRRLIGRVGGSWRYPRLLDFFDFSAGYRLAHYGVRDDVDRFKRPLTSHDPFGPTPTEPLEATRALLSLGGSWNRAERYANSVTTERSWRYAAFISYASPYVLSDRPELRGDLHVSHAWPLGGHRVLQWRTRVGAGPVYQDRSPPYSIAGLQLFDPQALLFGGAGSDFSVVRGFRQPVGEGARQLRGHVLGWTSVQANWPLLDVGSGLDTLPFFLGRMWLVTFVDAAAVIDLGEAKREPSHGSGWVVSAGAELRIDLEVGYLSQGTLVIGAARSFGDVASSQWYLRLAP